MKKSEATRLAILQKAFLRIYENGYQSTSVDDIISTTKVTKGAFYYHFKNKDEMGLAIIHEILKPKLAQNFMESLIAAPNPLEAIYNLVQHLLTEDSFLNVYSGCPVANFTQEMASHNPSFAKALQEITDQWIQLIALSLEKGKENGHVRTEVDSYNTAKFILSGYWGIREFGKISKNTDTYHAYLETLKSYLDTLS